jgi:hypothetical protein
LKEQNKTESDAYHEEQREDETLDKEEKRKKAQLRTRGPYRKAHANW